MKADLDGQADVLKYIGVLVIGELNQFDEVPSET
jgi:hypothetical protein